MSARQTWEQGRLRTMTELSSRRLAKRALQALGLHRRHGLNDGLRKLALHSDFTRWTADLTKPLFTDRDVHPTDVPHHVRYQLYRFLLDRHRFTVEPVSYFEFGVAAGDSIRWWSEHAGHPDAEIVGFDTFQGLPEDWRNKPKGTFSTGGQTPDIADERVRFERGLFQDTVPDYFAKNEPAHQAVYHFDADLYSSSLLCLFAISRRLKPGDCLIFDEFSDLLHEFRAWQDFTTAYSFRYDLIGAIRGHGFVAIELT